MPHPLPLENGDHKTPSQGSWKVGRAGNLMFKDNTATRPLHNSPSRWVELGSSGFKDSRTRVPEEYKKQMRDPTKLRLKLAKHVAIFSQFLPLARIGNLQKLSNLQYYP